MPVTATRTPGVASVREHLAVPGPARDLDWLRQALQAAVALEQATLPLYVSAMFSLDVQDYTAYNLLRSVVMEEMVHMAIAANVLAAIGGKPQIAGLDPHFPCHGLPGGVEPDLYAWLAPLSRPQLDNFLRIEAPAYLLAEEQRHEREPTIGAFYEAVEAAVEANSAAVVEAVRAGGGANQVADNIGIVTIAPTDPDPVASILAALRLVTDQGEGAQAHDLFAGQESEDEASHYCRFAEISYGHAYRAPASGLVLTRETEPEFFTGAAIPWPAVRNTLAVPTGGYERVLALDPERAAVEADLERFDEAYSGIMADLDLVWNGPASSSWPTLGKAVTAMGGLRVLACFDVLQHQVPEAAVEQLGELYPQEFRYLARYTDLDQPVYYGPCFRNLNGTRSAS